MGSRTKVALNFGVLMRDPLRPDTRRSSPVRVPRHVLRHRTGVCCLVLPALAVGPRLAQVGPSVLPSLRSASALPALQVLLDLLLIFFAVNLVGHHRSPVVDVSILGAACFVVKRSFVLSVSFLPYRCLSSSFLLGCLSGFSASSAPSQRYSVALQLVLCSVVSCWVASSLLASVAVAVLGSLLLHSSVLSWFYPCCSGCLHPILILCVLSSSFLMFPLRGLRT